MTNAKFTQLPVDQIKPGDLVVECIPHAYEKTRDVPYKGVRSIASLKMVIGIVRVSVSVEVSHRKHELRERHQITWYQLFGRPGLKKRIFISRYDDNATFTTFMRV